jgi:polar amino acid transport system substrate-binding protein
MGSRRRFLMTAAAMLSRPLLGIAAETRSLRLVCDEWPPYEFGEGSGIDGYGVVLTEAVLAEMGYIVERSPGSLPWIRVLSMIRQGEADVAVSGMWSAERASTGRFPKEPLFATRNAIFGLHAKPLSLHQASDLAGLRLGIVHGFLYPDHFLDSLPASTQVITSYDSPTNLQSLLLGHLDAVLEDERTGIYLIEHHHWQDRINPIPLMVLHAFEYFALFSAQTVTQTMVDDFSSRLAKFKQTEEGRALAARFQIAS